MIEDQRLKEIVAAPATATPEEVAALGTEVLRLRPVHAFVSETLKAIYINAKEEAQRTLVLDVITSAARTCMKRLKLATSTAKD